MVKKGLLLFLVAGIVLFLIILFFNMRNKDVRQIQKNLKTVVSLAEKKAGESSLVCLAKTQKIGSFFVENCQVDVGSPAPRMNNKDEVIGVFAQVCQIANALEIKLSEVSIDLESETSAKSSFVATAVISSSLIEKESVYPRQLSVEWEKIEGRWKIKSARVIEVLH